MIATASSTDIIGPPKAKQSSLSCAMALSGPCPRQHVLDANRGSLHHSGDGRDVIEMDQRQPGFELGITRDAHDCRIAGKQRRLAVGDAVDLDLAMWRALEP